MTTFSGAAMTGIYCLPDCGPEPLAEDVRTFELAAAAEAAGFRACLDCRPYRAANPIGARAPELVCRAVQLIVDGTLDEGTEEVLGTRLAISPRHLRRLFHDHLGVTPDQLARSRRAHFARRLLDDTDLGIAEVAFAAGFGSLRQFNRDLREIFGAPPRELRGHRRPGDLLAAGGGLAVRLPVQPPFDWNSTVAFLSDRAVPGVESVEDRVYRRTISLDGRAGVLEVHPGGADHLLLRVHLPYWQGLIHVVERAGRMVGVDAPGIRTPGAWGPLEVAVHAVVAQQGDPARARTRMGALVRNLGHAVPDLSHGLTHLFPSAEVLTGADLIAAGLPRATGEAVHALAAAVTTGAIVLDSSVGLDDLVARLTAIPGIGAATAHQIAVRLGHRDASPAATPR